MNQKRVAVLRGGPSSEYEVSLLTGASVIAALHRLHYHVTDIMVSKQGEWIVEGKVKTPDKALLATDVVVIALHGEYGEDGTVQRICERLHIPFTGSNAFPSSIAFNKDATKRTLQNEAITLPRHIKVRREDSGSTAEIIKVAERSFGPDYVIKPNLAGSSIGVEIVSGTSDLEAALNRVIGEYPECLIEERIKGIEATVAVLENYREMDFYALPPIEIVPAVDKAFFNQTAKYDGTTAEICPGRFSYEIKEKLQNAAITAHRALGLSQYSRSDFIIRGDEVYFLEVNTLPGLTNESLYPKASEAVGLSFDNLVDHLVRTARVY